MPTKKRLRLEVKPKAETVPSDDLDAGIFGDLLTESEKFCKATGLPKDLTMQIMTTDSDWSFILKVDALIETATKELVRHGLHFIYKKHTSQTDDLRKFVDNLSISGKTSIIALLKAAQIPLEEIAFLDHVRKLRNAYAHNIKNVDIKLIDLIIRHPEKSNLIKHLSQIRKYDESDLILSFQKDTRFLRFLIISGTLKILFYSYHLAVKPAAIKAKKPVNTNFATSRYL